MRCVGYISSATNIDNIDNDIKEIIKKAIDHNDGNDITGILIYNDGNILQFIEGDGECVSALFKRISNAPRHKDIIVIFDEEIERRVFGRWTTALKRINDLPEKSRDRCSELMKVCLNHTESSPEHLKVAADFIALYKDNIR